MILWALLSVVSAWSFTGLLERGLGFDINSDCKFSRLDALGCIVEFIDVDQNGQVSEAEYERAKRLFLPPRARSAMRAANAIVSRIPFLSSKLQIDVPYHVIRKSCDINNNTLLDPWDILHGEGKCLVDQNELCIFEGLCKRAKTIKNT